MAKTELESTRAGLRALAEEVLKLTDTYQPAPPDSWATEEPLITKAKELVMQAQSTVDYMGTLTRTTTETVCLRALLEFNVIQSIPAEDFISAQELGTKTGVDQTLLVRLFRILVNSGAVRQDENGGYAHTHVSANFCHPMVSNMFKQIYETGLGPISRLTQFLKYQAEITGKIEEPGASRDNTYWNLNTYAVGEHGRSSTFQLMEKDPVKMQEFQSNLGGSAHLHPWTGFYDFSKLATPEQGRVVFVDVGGGHGHAISSILKAHPDIKPEQCVLQDSGAVIDFAQKGNKELPHEVEKQVHDFFSPNPVKGAKAYFMRAIAHDLSDQNTIRVLKQIVPVMERDSKVLIADNNIPEGPQSGNTAVMDMMMMAIGGKERTEKDFKDVIDAAGLKLDGVYRAGEHNTFAIMEASLR